ncbi:MAG: ribose-5-phosphate isomerase RpiA [Phycisphaerales bacterium]|nr:ribose-5-phosphate isomerase RpiA [Phycisphaerales bacterium]
MAETQRDDEMARLAVAPVRDGMIVGLGTGRAASRGIVALGARVRDEGMKIHTVATSAASADLARSVGLTVLEMERTPRVDYLFDGADEVAPDLSMIKGRGGAMTREKIVAHAAGLRVYLVQRDKLVDHLGLRCPLPVEVMAYGLTWVREHLAGQGLRGEVRHADGRVYHTDNGNLVLDVQLRHEHDGAAVDRLLNDLPGVVGHGLFLHEADEVLVEEAGASPGAGVERLKRTT